MAKPQLENGYTKIANELLDQLAKLHLPPSQWQIVIFIIRKTYGYKKKSDYISISRVTQGTGLDKYIVSKSLKSLKSKNVITRDKNQIGLQKNWELW